jgi:hypothetical protein
MANRELGVWMEPTVALLKILSWRAWEKSHENSVGVAGL